MLIRSALRNGYKTVAELVTVTTVVATFFRETERYREGRNVDSGKQHGRCTDNHLGRSTGMIVGRYPVMVAAP